MPATWCSCRKHEILVSNCPDGRRGRLLLAAWRSAGASGRRRDTSDVSSRFALSCDLGTGDDVRSCQRRSSGPRHRRSVCLCSDSCSGKSLVDDLASVSPNRGGRVSLPSRDHVGNASVGLCSHDPWPLVVGDNAAVRRDGALPIPAPSQVSALAELLSPVLGARAGRQAEALLRAFGSISGVSAASAEALGHVLGVDRHLALPFIVSRRIHEAGMRERVRHEPLDADNQALLAWLIARFAGLPDESLIAIYRDRNGAFSGEETFCSGAKECVIVEPRALFRQAMRLDCGGLLLAHNHPSGDARPSILDIDATRRIAAHGQLLDVELIDHLIIAGNSVTSMKRAGLL